MASIIQTIVVLALSCHCFASASNGGGHRILIVDNLKSGRNTIASLLVFDVESGKVVAQAKDVGHEPILGLSSRGDLVGLLTNDLVGGKFKPESRLQVYRTSDLRRLQTGMLPFAGPVLGDWQASPLVHFSPDGQEVIVERMVSRNQEQPYVTYDQCLLKCFKWEAKEDRFELCRKEVMVPRCRAARVLRVADWPRVQIWNSYLGAVEVIDFDSGKILSRLPLHDLALLQAVDPAVLEKPDISQELFQLMSPWRGLVLPAGGRYAYYIPRQIPDEQPGFLKKVDLSVNPPKMVRRGEEPAKDLRPRVAAATEAGQAIFVMKQKIEGAAEIASRRVKIFSTDNLKLLNEIDLSIEQCDQLEASRDGKLVYALDRERGRLAVIDVATAREVKVLEKFAGHPVLVYALPEAGAGE